MSAVPLFEAIEPDETEGAEAAAIDPDEAEGARAAAIEAAEAEAFELEECGGLATAGGGGVPTGGGPAGPTDPPILYRLQVTLSEEAYVRLAQLRELMRHQVPDGDLAVIVDQALTRLLEHVQRRKFGKLAGRGKRRKQEP